MKMYANILEKVRLREEKHGIKYAKTDGKLYGVIKALYVVTLVYTILVNLLFIISCIFTKSVFSALKNSVYTVIALSVVLIAAFVILSFKKYLWTHIAAFGLNTLSCVGLCFTFGKLLEDVIGYKAKFYYCHFVPLCILAVCCILLALIAIRAILKTKKTYKTVVDELYNSYKKNNENKTVSYEEWDKILREL